MKFGIEFVPNESVFKLASNAKAAEEQGFENVWVTDHYNNRDVYSTVSVMALATNKIKIGVGVTNPYTRSPVVTAAGIASVNEISGNRAVLGIGPGDKMTFDSLGLGGEKPLTAVRETAEVVRNLLTGKKITYDGDTIQLKNAKLDFANPKKTEKGTEIPIYVGAQGPKMLEMAGAVGDGVLINASHPDDFKVAQIQIEKGAQSINRDLKEIDIAAYTCFSIDDDIEKAYAAAKPVVAFIIAGANDVLLKRHNIPAESKNAIIRAVSKGEFKELNTIITNDMADRFAVIGNSEICLQKIKKLEEAGVTQMVAGSPIGPNKEKSIKLLGKIIAEYEHGEKL